MSYPRRGEAVTSPCIFCCRPPRPSETFGTQPRQWDFTGICPECWDKTTLEPELGGEG